MASLCPMPMLSCPMCLALFSTYWYFSFEMIAHYRYVAEGMLALIASLVPHYIIGMALGAGVYGMFMLCEGFFKLPAHIP